MPKGVTLEAAQYAIQVTFAVSGLHAAGLRGPATAFAAGRTEEEAADDD